MQVELGGNTFLLPTLLLGLRCYIPTDNSCGIQQYSLSEFRIAAVKRYFLPQLSRVCKLACLRKKIGGQEVGMVLINFSTFVTYAVCYCCIIKLHSISCWLAKARQVLCPIYPYTVVLYSSAHLASRICQCMCRRLMKLEYNTLVACLCVMF